MLQNKTKRERVGIGGHEIGLAIIVAERGGGEYPEGFITFFHLSCVSLTVFLNKKFNQTNNWTAGASPLPTPLREPT